uniref:Ribosomal protein S21 n=1 Tax=Salix viminalis TaxID=40686 RepID=A0A6N2NHB7_SALVM
MNTIARRAYNLCRSPLLPVQGVKSVSGEHQIQQCRGIRVRVHNGNLEQALKFMQRKMQSSGIERQIKNLQTHHVKNSEKRVLARKKLQRRIQSQELAHRIKVILADKASWINSHLPLSSMKLVVTDYYSHLIIFKDAIGPEKRTWACKKIFEVPFLVQDGL